MSRQPAPGLPSGLDALSIELCQKRLRPAKFPVLYLPHVRRQELRAAGDCPPHLQPLIELQYRGRVWHQSNGHDWSVRAFSGLKRWPWPRNRGRPAN